VWIYNTALPDSITAACVVKAAWAFVLSQYTTTSDVLFGEIVSGRNLPDPLMEKIAGCCVNMVPVRIAMQHDWTILDLLRFVHYQQISRLPHECLGFQKILHECIDLPSASHFTSRINHRSVDFDTGLTLDGKCYAVSGSLAPGAGDIADIAITTTSTAGKMEILIGYIGNRVPAEVAGMLLISLSDAIDHFINKSRTALLKHLQILSQARNDIESI
jgi:non-ribosomal peptide synthetase component F